MSVGDLLSEPFADKLPETVCTVGRPEFVQLVQTPFVQTMWKRDREHGTTSRNLQLTCRPCQSLNSLWVVPNTIWENKTQI